MLYRTQKGRMASEPLTGIWIPVPENMKPAEEDESEQMSID